MKFLVAILIVIACVCANEWIPKSKEQLKKIRICCLKKHPLSTEQMNKYKRFDFPNEKAVRQLLLCNAVEIGIFTLKAGYHADRMAKQFIMDDIKEETVLKLAKDCIAKYPKGNKSSEVAAYEVHFCLMKETIIGEKIKNFINQKQQLNI